MTSIFVFGSNLAGRHGKGAARDAVKKHGAVYGKGVGLQGRSYAIPTKDKNLKTLPLEHIKTYVDEFVDYATRHPELTFEVTRVGCGLAGYTDDDMAPLFKKAPPNCKLDAAWVGVNIHEGVFSNLFQNSSFFFEKMRFEDFAVSPPSLSGSWPTPPKLGMFYPFGPESHTPNAYWFQIEKAGLATPEQMHQSLMRRQSGRARYMPISLAFPLIKWPSFLTMTMSDTANGADVDELVRFHAYVPERNNGMNITIQRSEWAPDVDDWTLLARFFIRNFVGLAVHEAYERFTFADHRIFDPHLEGSDEGQERKMQQLDCEIQRQHDQSVIYRQRVYDEKGKA